MSSASTPDLPIESPGAELAPRRRRSIAPVVIALVVVAIGVLVISSSTNGGSGLYSYPLAELTQRRAELDGKEVKVAGRIAKGSVRGRPAGADFRFDLEDLNGHKLAVAYPKLLPDPFEEGREAIVQGTLRDGTIYASSLTVKCPSRYADVESMSEAERQRYYQTDYRKHATMGRDGATPPPTPAKD